MASQEAWYLTKVFFRYFSPFKYILLYDSQSRTIRRNTKQQNWFYFQASITILSAFIGICFVVDPNATYENDPNITQSMVYIFAILYGGIAGLYTVSTISVGIRGDTFYNCLNALIRMQHKQQSK